MDIKQLNEELEKILEDDNKLLNLSDNLIKRLNFGYLYPEYEAKLKRFNSLDELENYIRKTNSFPDNFFYKGGLFTMSEYDMSGKELFYASPELGIEITVETPENRYDHKGNYKNMEMNIYEDNASSWRFDITYYVPKAVYDKLSSH